MERELYEAAVDGNEEELVKNEGDEGYLRQKTSEGNNMLHISIQYGQLQFAKKAVSMYPPLMWEENSDHNTPLHFAAELRDTPNIDGAVLESIVKDACQRLSNENMEALRKKNFMGNTALHLAIIHGRLEIAHVLLAHDPSLASIHNDSRETPLHLVFKHFPHLVQIPGDEIEKKKIKFVRLMEQEEAKWETDDVVEKMAVMIRMLLAISSEVASRKDVNGLTPLHLAAGIPLIYNLQVIQHIIKCYPQCKEVCDGRRRTILHHLINRIQHVPQGKDFLTKTLLHILKNHQDKDGNTPFHLSIMHNDNVMVKLLYYIFKADTFVKNKLGESPISLLEKDNYKVLDEEICRRAEYGDVLALEEHLLTFGSQFFELLDSNGRNVMHKLFMIKSGNIIFPTEFLTFIKNHKQVLTSLHKPDNNGDTPIHILARLNPNNIMIYLAIASRCNPTYTEALYPGPKPNDPKCFTQSYQKYIYAWEKLGTSSILQDIIENVLHIDDNMMDERHFRNEDGMSPLAIAIQSGNFKFAERLVSSYPNLAQVKNPKGQTFWHLLVNAPPGAVQSFEFRDSSFANNHVLELLDRKDNDENTALHLAIQHRQFDVVKLFLCLRETSTNGQTPKFNEHLLQIPNKEGDTPGAMIGSLPYLPKEFEESILKDPTFIGIRSIWGIPTTHMKEYVNTMGVIAALLTTITFTAAFTVPGGLNQEKGTPLLINGLPFKVFLISDVLAMCFSIMVLFCLLWIMATGDKIKSVVLLDFGIIMLLASFYTTLWTFMTGLYATIHHDEIGIAIFTFIPCTMLLLLMHKYFVIKLVIPAGKYILIRFEKAFQYARNSRKRCMSFSSVKCYPWSSSSMPMQHSLGDRSVLLC